LSWRGPCYDGGTSVTAYRVQLRRPPPPPAVATTTTTTTTTTAGDGSGGDDDDWEIVTDSCYVRDDYVTDTHFKTHF